MCSRRMEHGQPMFANWEEQSLEGDLQIQSVQQFTETKKWAFKKLLTLRTCIYHLCSSNGWITYYIKFIS